MTLSSPEPLETRAMIMISQPDVVPQIQNAEIPIPCSGDPSKGMLVLLWLCIINMWVNL